MLTSLFMSGVLPLLFPPGRARFRLIEVALDLIRRNGVLAGLNLREVADGAGVNRGNIYHYFGSRRELLRAAIPRRFEAVAESLTADRQGFSFVERRLRAFRTADTIHDSQLRALLVIDGDDTVARCRNTRQRSAACAKTSSTGTSIAPPAATASSANRMLRASIPM
jgi:AcrR family transcriptional regulator